MRKNPQERRDLEDYRKAIGYYDKPEPKVIEPKKTRIDKGIKRTPYQQHVHNKYRSYLNRANKKKIAFDLTETEVATLLNGVCAYCGSTRRISIDRIESSGGYTKDNVTSACATCNTMKWDMSPEDFLKHIRSIINHTKYTLGGY